MNVLNTRAQTGVKQIPHADVFTSKLHIMILQGNLLKHFNLKYFEQIMLLDILKLHLVSIPHTNMQITSSMPGMLLTLSFLREL